MMLKEFGKLSKGDFFTVSLPKKLMGCLLEKVDDKTGKVVEGTPQMKVGKTFIADDTTVVNKVRDNSEKCFRCNTKLKLKCTVNFHSIRRSSNDFQYCYDCSEFIFKLLTEKV